MTDYVYKTPTRNPRTINLSKYLSFKTYKITKLFLKEITLSYTSLSKKKSQLVENILGPLEFYKLRLDQYT